jgi:hypothetical protein
MSLIQYCKTEPDKAAVFADAIVSEASAEHVDRLGEC